MILHQRGADLLVNLMDAEQHLDSMSQAELRELIREAIDVFGKILERDIPEEQPQPSPPA